LDCGVGAVVKNEQLIAAGGQVIKILPDSDFCLHCSGMFDLKEAMNEFLSSEEKTRRENQGYIRGANIAAPQIYSLNMMVASWAIWIFKRLISEEELDFDGIAINAKDFKSCPWNEPRKKANNCPTCGMGGIVFQGDDVNLLYRDSNKDQFIPVNSANANNHVKATNKENTAANMFAIDFTSFVIGDNRSNQFPSGFVGYM